MNKFVILGEARSGTTTISSLLGRGLRKASIPLEKKFPVMGEPFPMLYKSWGEPELGANTLYSHMHGKDGYYSQLPQRTRDYVDPLKSSKHQFGKDAPQYVFDDVIDLAYDKSYGIKELIRNRDFICKFMAAAKRRDFKYIHLRRYNYLSMAISLELSRQHGIWNIPPDIPEKRKLHKKHLEVISSYEVKPIKIGWLEYTVNNLSKRKEVLETYKDENWITVDFKDLYSERVSLEDKSELFLRITKLLDIDIFKESFIKEPSYEELIEAFFSNKKRVTKESYYKQIPNINEILTHFNCSFEELCERY